MSMYTIVGILAFGLLIAIHELGHFLSAKLMGVRVNEFAIGMGPKLLKKQGKETLYTLRALPFGGFCAMDGQDETLDDPRAFTSQKRWRRVVILLSGSLFNFIAAFIIVAVLNAGATGFIGTTITALHDDFPNQGENGLMAGDRIVSINGERLHYLQDFIMFMQLARSDEVDLVISRNGEHITLSRFPLQQREFIENGVTVVRYGITFNVIEATFFEQLRYSGYQTFNFIRMIRVSLAQLFSGQAGVDDMSSAIGIVDTMSTIAQQAPTIGAAIGSIAFLTAFIGVNLAVFNLLPIPALDGGRILFIVISFLIEKIARRKLDPKYEGYIHTGAMILLLGFTAYIMFNDVLRLVLRVENG
ncbi:MAG: site-2 protease family protein [Oscillospiraceae bacterium]|nr:site-2 protease family protein [Oscillospiraceae bacterium]